MFSLFLPTQYHFWLSKTALTTVFTVLGLMGGAVRHVLVWTKSTILQQINCKTNRNIILNLQSWQGKKWEQCEGPVQGSSLKSVSSTHDKADCDCGNDRLWTITSDVFIDFRRDPIWNIAAVSAKNAPYRSELPELDWDWFENKVSVQWKNRFKENLFIEGWFIFISSFWECEQLLFLPQIYWHNLNIWKREICFCCGFPMHSVLKNTKEKWKKKCC